MVVDKILGWPGGHPCIFYERHRSPDRRYLDVSQDDACIMRLARTLLGTCFHLPRWLAKQRTDGGAASDGSPRRFFVTQELYHNKQRTLAWFGHSPAYRSLIHSLEVSINMNFSFFPPTPLSSFEHMIVMNDKDKYLEQTLICNNKELIFLSFCQKTYTWSY